MYLEEYIAGNELDVWNEIGSMRIDDLTKEQHEDILNVCRETMSRVRSNIKEIISALHSINYNFSLYPDGSKHLFEAPFLEPDKKLEEKIKKIEAKAGSLPLTIKTFWEAIGGICLIGYYDGWPEYSDQLVVGSIDDNLEEIESQIEIKAEDDVFKDYPFMLYISPDDYHKDNVSGGQWYNMELPCYTVDAIVHDVPSGTTFIDYLRNAFNCKGFPGCKKFPAKFDKLEIKLLKI